jgi:hypothetical protein
MGIWTISKFPELDHEHQEILQRGLALGLNEIRGFPVMEGVARVAIYRALCNVEGEQKPAPWKAVQKVVMNVPTWTTKALLERQRLEVVIEDLPRLSPAERRELSVRLTISRLMNDNIGTSDEQSILAGREAQIVETGAASLEQDKQLDPLSATQRAVVEELTIRQAMEARSQIVQPDLRLGRAAQAARRTSQRRGKYIGLGDFH